VILQGTVFHGHLSKTLYVILVLYNMLLQVNGIEKKTICLPLHELDKLTHDDALKLALSQSDLQRYTSGYKIVSTAFTKHPSYEAVINIRTERISKEKHQHMQDG
jgi:hypothetical protein